jgi:phosphoribosylformimino-5-aminoimidazole carboxamide ribotide isomerase
MRPVEGAPPAFVLYPAIDLRGGRCVRLQQGEPARQQVFSSDPVAVARGFVAEGAQALHVVDLDGAFAGAPQQLPLVAALVRAAGVPVQFGGGLRAVADVEAALEAGVWRVVVGTRALEPAFFGELLRRFGPERIVAGLDVRGRRVVVAGWQGEAAVDLPEAAERLRGLGAQEAVCTQVLRDGMLAGPDLAAVDVVAAAGLRVVASGGVSSLADVRALAARTTQGVAGAIVGRALYTGTLRLSAALAAAREGLGAVPAAGGGVRPGSPDPGPR